MNLATVLTLLILSPTPALPGAELEARPDPIWRYHLTQLHEGLRRGAWFAAKQSLAELRLNDEAAYRAHGFALTAAWIAEREGHWDTLLRLLKDLEENAWTALARMNALERLGRPSDALEASFDRRVKFRGRDRWALYALRARCYEALDQPRKAIDYYRKLARSGVDTNYRSEANQSLAALYYQNGERERGRKLAEFLQSRRAGSDAALFSVDLQERLESDAYLSRRQVWKRFAEVCYRNRDFDRADYYFGKVLETGEDRDAERARYFKLLIHNKEARPTDTIHAYNLQRDAFEKSDFAGPAAFQFARSLFMAGRDADAIDFVEDYWARPGASAKWRQECARLLILALRRSGRYREFQALEDRLRQEKAASWLHQYFHRNGVAWSLKESRPQEALYHLREYRRHRLSRRELPEADLWEGMIQWALANRADAVASWLRVVRRDPNHYFGLVAREFLRAAANAGAAETRWSEAARNLDRMSLAELRDLYYLAPDDGARAKIAAALAPHLPDSDWLDALKGLAIQPDAGAYAAIGRYDLAADVLKKRGLEPTQYRYLMALWRQWERDLYQSIRHGELLAKAYPRWTPYELMPTAIQQLTFPMGFIEIIGEKAADQGVDPYLLLAIIREESRFNVQAKSWASARGLMQFIPDTAREIAAELEEIEDFSPPMLYDPNTSIALGARYVNKLMDTFGGVSLYTVAAYNAGESAVERWRAFSAAQDPVQFVWDVTYDETKYYCQKVLRAYHHYTRVYEGGVSDVIQAPSLSP